MQLTGGEFDVIVIGSGRSGRETALAATREGCSTLLISLSPGTIASMMWSTSGKSPLNQELIQAFIPSGHENGNSKEQSTVTIQTSLHQPDRESPVYLLQAQVQQHQHKLPGSDGAIVHVGESRPASFGSCRSLREREMQIREKLLRRNIHPPESEKPEETAVAKSEVRVSTRKRTSSIYQQRNNYLRKKLLDRHNGRDQPIPTQTRQKEEPRIASKEDSAHTSEDASPLLLPPLKDTREFPDTLVRMDRPRRKKQRSAGAAKVRPLIYREKTNPEKSVDNRLQALVWENSKGGKSATVRKEAGSRNQTKASKWKLDPDGEEKKDAMKEGELPPPPPNSARNPKNLYDKTAESGHHSPERSDASRQRSVPSELEREKKKVSFIEREQARMILEQSSNPLKREAIQLEDPYGYNAWEDIMPFSKGKENNSTLNASEKRQIALRGLRNLINNLG